MTTANEVDHLPWLDTATSLTQVVAIAVLIALVLARPTPDDDDPRAVTLGDDVASLRHVADRLASRLARTHRAPKDPS